MVTLFIFFFITSPFFCCQFCLGVDFLAPNQFLFDNGGTLVSAGNKFELGFFSPFNILNKRYVGIWFKNIPEQTVVWVANKDSPLLNSSGVLTISPTGNIVILENSTNSVIWSANTASTSVSNSNPILQLLDNGNLVLKNGSDDGVNQGGYLWQSFDHPCDTLLAGMKLGWNFTDNQEWYLTSWKNLQDPGTGSLTLRIDRRALPQALLRKGSDVVYRSGTWDGARFGADDLEANTVFDPRFVYDSENEYYTFENADDSVVSRFVLNQSMLIQHLSWSILHNQWVDIATVQSDACDRYGLWGNYGNWSINTNPLCSYPPGFKPRLLQDWDGMDWSGGCVRKKELNCCEPAGFRKFSNLKLPDTAHFMAKMKGNEALKCAETCLKNCSCVAYAKTEVNGCVLW